MMLTHIPWFSSLSDTETQAVLNRVTKKIGAKNTIIISEGNQSTLCLRRLRVVKLLPVLAQFHAGKMMDTTDYFKVEFNNTIINNKLLP